MPSKSTLLVATAVAAGLVAASRGLPNSGTSTRAESRPVDTRPVVAAHHYANCAELRAVWPHGVGWASAHDRVADPAHDRPVTDFHHSKAIYSANRSLDRDGDHIACEAH